MFAVSRIAPETPLLAKYFVSSENQEGASVNKLEKLKQSFERTMKGGLFAVSSIFASIN